LTRKYLQIVDKEIKGEATEKIWEQCERLEKQIGDDPINILYSEKRDEVISYRQKVMEYEADKDDYLFSLAGYKGETVESLSNKSVADLQSFAERFIKDINGGHKS
jgi:hypothetical protein